MSKIDGVESCTNHSCVFGHPGGLGTNGQCHCLDIRPPDARIRATRNVLALRARIAELEASNAALREAAEGALHALESSRVFVTSRERIHKPDGESWYDERVAKLRAALKGEP